MKTIAILGAMPEETQLLAQTCENMQVHEEAGLQISVGEIVTHKGERVRMVITVAGMGTVNASATTQFLATKYQPHAILFSGIAGNLTSTLHINDVVLGETLVYLDTDMDLIAQSAPCQREFHSDTHLLEVAQSVLKSLEINFLVGKIATGNHFVAGILAEEVKEQTRADAVEMEGAAVAHIAAKNNIPVLILRAMSDNADTEYEEFHTFDISEYANTAAHITEEIVRSL